MEEFSFCLVRFSDFDEIVSLFKGIYEGYDYLFIEFYKWMKMENMVIMLVFFGDKIVGLRVVYIIDDGKMYIRRVGCVFLEFCK